MRTRSKLVLAALTATTALALAVGTAPASRLNFSSRTFRITWSALRFFPEGEELQIRCPTTLEGSFHSATITKVLGKLIGLLTRAITKIEACVGEDRALFLQNFLPSHIVYREFTGTLPSISGVRVLLQGIHYSFFFMSVECLYGNEEEVNEGLVGTFQRVGGGQVLTFAFDRTSRIRLNSGELSCPSRAGVEGTGQNFVLGETRRWILELI
jgi:hypothetical protein